MKAKIPGRSPGGIYDGMFFLTGSWRENTRAGMIPAGSQRGSGFLAGSRQDPGGFFTRVNMPESYKMISPQINKFFSKCLTLESNILAWKCFFWGCGGGGGN